MTISSKYETSIVQIFFTVCLTKVCTAKLFSGNH